MWVWSPASARERQGCSSLAVDTTARWPDLTTEHARTFWAGCQDHRLLMPFCDKCGRARWYPLPICPDCRSVHLHWREVSAHGTLYSHTTVHRAFHPAFAEWVPYVSALVTLDDAANARFVTRLLDSPATITAGMRVAVAFTEIAPNLVLPFFRRAASEGGANLE
jgi:uncharacterized OB-fold protein